MCAAESVSSVQSTLENPRGKSQMSMLLLKLINSNDRSIRGMTRHDDSQVFSVIDSVNTFCNKELDSSYGRVTFFRLIKEGSEHKQELESCCIYLRLPGEKRDTPCMTIRGLQRLLMILGGKVAADYRELVEGTFTRIMAGDQSLIEVINANGASKASLQKAFRAALAPIRLFESDLTPNVASVLFEGKEHMLRIQITAFGDVTSQMTDYVSLLTGHDTPSAASDHYRKILAQCPILQHCNLQLRDHIQVKSGVGIGS